MKNSILRLICLLCFAGLCACSTTQDRSIDLQRAAELNAEMGNRYLAQGKLDIAKRKFDKAIRQDPQLAVAHAGYALFWSRVGDTRKANKHFKKALKLDPTNSAFLNNYGSFLCTQGQVAEAEKRFLAALKDPLYKTPEYAYTNAGRCALKIKDYEKAEAYFGKALKANSYFPDALQQMAVIHNQRGDYKKAAGYMEKFERHGTHTAETLWLAIQLSQKLGDKNKTASYKLRLKNKFPDSEQTIRLRDLEN